MQPRQRLMVYVGLLSRTNFSSIKGKGLFRRTNSLSSMVDVWLFSRTNGLGVNLLSHSNG